LNLNFVYQVKDESLELKMLLMRTSLISSMTFLLWQT